MQPGAGLESLLHCQLFIIRSVLASLRRKLPLASMDAHRHGAGASVKAAQRPEGLALAGAGAVAPMCLACPRPTIVGGPPTMESEMLGEMWKKVMDWLATVAGLFQALILGLLGGVPAKAPRARPVPVVEAAPRSDGLEEWQRIERAPPPPRWRPSTVRACLGRVSEGKPLRPRDTAGLPQEVVGWLLSMTAEDADGLRHLPADALRADAELWAIGGEVLDADMGKPGDQPDDPDAGPGAAPAGQRP